MLGVFLALTQPRLAWSNELESFPQGSTYEQNRHYAQLSPQSQDFELLIQAARKFLATNMAQIESQLNISGNFSGGTVNFYTQINTIMEAPKKFRSQIAFTNGKGVIGKQYVVVSDGNQVWIYNVEEEKYSVMTYENFLESNDDFLIGMLSSLFLEILANTEQIELFREISVEELREAFNKNLNTDINQVNSDKETIAENEYTTYSYTESEEGFTIKAFINPSSADIKYIHLTGVEDEVSLFMEEQIIKKTNLQSIPSDTFRFLPPINVQKVDEPIPIEPF